MYVYKRVECVHQLMKCADAFAHNPQEGGMSTNNLDKGCRCMVSEYTPKGEFTYLVGETYLMKYYE